MNASLMMVDVYTNKLRNPASSSELPEIGNEARRKSGGSQDLAIEKDSVGVLLEELGS